MWFRGRASAGAASALRDQPPETSAGQLQQSVDEAWARLRSFGTGGNYVNFQLAEDGSVPDEPQHPPGDLTGPTISWLTSYATSDRLYCVYIAPGPDLIKEHAARGGFPGNRVSEVRAVIDPTTVETR